jgi:MFS family permease
MTIDAREAAAALGEIATITARVRQSRIYRFASASLILWGAVVGAGNLVTFLAPDTARWVWPVVWAAGIAGSVALALLTRGPRYEWRLLASLLVFFGFGLLWSAGIAQFTPRQLGVFWPTYFMLAYVMAGLWFGTAFVAIGLGITALTLAGYFWAGAWFPLWMAVVNGGGLVLGGLWMRRP